MYSGWNGWLDDLRVGVRRRQGLPAARDIGEPAQSHRGSYSSGGGSELLVGDVGKQVLPYRQHHSRRVSPGGRNGLVGDSHDHVSDLLLSVNIPMGLDHIVERVRAVDHYSISRGLD